MNKNLKTLLAVGCCGLGFGFLIGYFRKQEKLEKEERAVVKERTLYLYDVLSEPVATLIPEAMTPEVHDISSRFDDDKSMKTLVFNANQDEYESVLNKIADAGYSIREEDPRGKWGTIAKTWIFVDRKHPEPFLVEEPVQPEKKSDTSSSSTLTLETRNLTAGTEAAKMIVKSVFDGIEAMASSSEE